jgi:hypothetical protein
VNLLRVAEQREQQESGECEDPTDHAEACRQAVRFVIEVSLICL